MGRFDRNIFVEFLIENRVVGFFDEAVTLKSGRRSHFYVNWRRVANDAFLLGQLSEFLVSFILDNDFSPDCIYGVPEGATKLGVISSFKLATRASNFAVGSHVIPMGRGLAKSHGDPCDRFFVGEPKGRVVVVEDVTTTGGSLLRAIENLKKINASVVAAIGLTNRMERTDDGKTVEDAVKSLGIPYFSLSNADEFLPKAVTAFKPDKKIVEEIKKEFRQYGVREINI